MVSKPRKEQKGARNPPLANCFTGGWGRPHWAPLVITLVPVKPPGSGCWVLGCLLPVQIRYISPLSVTLETANCYPPIVAGRRSNISIPFLDHFRLLTSSQLASSAATLSPPHILLLEDEASRIVLETPCYQQPAFRLLFPPPRLQTLCFPAPHYHQLPTLSDSRWWPVTIHTVCPSNRRLFCPSH